MVISAPMGFSQNDSCSKRTWRATNGRSLTPRNEPLTGTSVALIAVPPANRPRRPTGRGPGVAVSWPRADAPSSVSPR